MTAGQGTLLDKLSDPAMAQAEGERGAAQALSALSVETWSQDAAGWILQLRSGVPFTADDLVEVCGLPTESDLFARCNNALGGVIKSLNNRGFIRAIGYRPSERVSSRGRVLRVWERR